jgi:phosphatidylserine decarboxylase
MTFVEKMWRAIEELQVELPALPEIGNEQRGEHQNSRKSMFSKYGIDNLVWLVAAAVVFLGLAWYVARPWYSVPLGIIGGFILCMALWFFRDPERVLASEATADRGVIVAPADGKVVQISRILEKEYLHEEAIQISIFLSPLNVHVNRYPASGVIEYSHYYPGDYLVAWHPKSSELNERSVFGLNTGKGKVVFKQITGYLARRIVFDTKVNDTVHAGDRFGMMKFGSRMDIIVPLQSEILVHEGDNVSAAENVIARLK